MDDQPIESTGHIDKAEKLGAKLAVFRFLRVGCAGVYHPAQPTHQTEKVLDGVPIYPPFSK